jgi:hypothetical protein
MSLASSLSKAETILTAVPNLFAVIDSAVQSVEASLGGVPGISGSAKLAAATSKVNTFLTAAGTDLAAVVDTAALFSPMINEAVSIFNATGLFKKAAPAATPAA